MTEPPPPAEPTLPPGEADAKALRYAKRIARDPAARRSTLRAIAESHAELTAIDPK